MANSWWSDAACAGRDPEWWWSNDPRTGRAAAEVCLGCPVRDPCLREALAIGDYGVIRGAMLLTRTRNGRQAIPLVCANCHNAAVMTTAARYARFCSTACGSAARRASSATVHAGV
jgi:hypothetical protein